MKICSPKVGNITRGRSPRVILPVKGDQIVMLPSHKGNNCLLCRLIFFAIKKKAKINADQHCPYFICSQAARGK